MNQKYETCRILQWKATTIKMKFNQNIELQAIWIHWKKRDLEIKIIFWIISKMNQQDFRTRPISISIKVKSLITRDSVAVNLRKFIKLKIYIKVLRTSSIQVLAKSNNQKNKNK